MKYSNFLGVAAGLILIAACFLPWTFHPDLQTYFTGFYSEKNVYGKPGKIFIFLSVVCMLLFIIPKIWAKRTNLLIAALIVAFAIKCFILFTSCYKGICPEKQTGIYLVVAMPLIIILCAIFPQLDLKDNATTTGQEPKE